MSTRAPASAGCLPPPSLMHRDGRVEESAPTAPSSGDQTDSPEATEERPTNNRRLSELLSNMNEGSRPSERLAILSLSHRDPIPELVLGLRPLDSHATCYRKLYHHLIYLRHWLREPKHSMLFSEKDVREFHRLFTLFKEGAMKDKTWLHEMRYREAHKAVSEIWKDLRRLIEELQDKETAMLAGGNGQERREVPMPTAAPASDEPRLWGSIQPPDNDELAFDDR